MEEQQDGTGSGPLPVAVLMNAVALYSMGMVAAGNTLSAWLMLRHMHASLYVCLFAGLAFELSSLHRPQTDAYTKS